MDFWPTIADVLRGREWMLLERARMALEGAIDEVERAADAGGPVVWDVGRMKVLLALTELGQALLRTLMSMRAPRTPDRFGHWLKGAVSVVHRVRKRL